MEYVFGTKGDMEVLKVKGDAHTDLTGFPSGSIPTRPSPTASVLFGSWTARRMGRATATTGTRSTGTTAPSIGPAWWLSGWALSRRLLKGGSLCNG